jgi:YVTN family beta-propeller protein
MGCPSSRRRGTLGRLFEETWVVVAGATEGGGAGLCFGVLGPLQVTRSGERLRLGGHQQRAVLAVLLAESGGVVSVGRLADALWGEQTPSGFITTVQTYVFHLREVLEPDRKHGTPGQVLVTEPGGYSLDTSGSAVDAAIFERSLSTARHAMGLGAYSEVSAELKQALGLWRGDVLADVADLGFVAPLAARLEQMRQGARALRIEAELALGLHADALPEIDGLAAEHPLWEQLQAQRITALYRSGRQSDALEAYRELRNRLGEELGIEPSSPLQQLHQAVLTQAAALDWQGPKVVEPAQPASPKEPDRPESSPLPAPQTTTPTLTPIRQTDGPGPFSLGDRWVRVATAVIAVLLAISLAIVIALPWIRPSPVSFPGNSVGSINQDGSLGPSVRVGQSPDGLTYAAGSLWAANRSENTVSRIDPNTHTVQTTIPVGNRPVALTSTDLDVWVANFDDGTVSRVNIRTNRVVGEPARVGAGPIAIASGRSGVWVVSYAAGTIQRIDPTTGQADTAIPVGHGPDGIVMDDTSIWVTDALDGTVVEFYPVPGSGKSAWVLKPGTSVQVAGGPQGIALTPTYVWVASRLSQTVTRINRATLQTISFAVGDGPHSVVVTGGAVWVSNEYDGTLTSIDQLSNEVHRLPSIGASPRDLAVDSEGRIWVAAGAFADPAHQGGTLRVVGASVPGGQVEIDPVSVTDAATTRVQRFVYDGLVALGMSGGPDSQQIVTDLAQGPLPLPSDENRTYVFTVRPDIRYSTGAFVRASDFRTALRKALTVGERREQFANIVGGRNCIDHAAACDLSAGLITDDAARRVTFKLEKPDPNFLYTLSRFLYPVPPGTPATVSGVPVPGTGPYRISAYVPGKKLTLERNRYYSQWSFAAQPAGYPAVIDFRMVADDRASAQEVIAGRADVAWVGPGSPSLLADLKRRYPDGDPAAPQLKEDVLDKQSLLVSPRVGNYDSNGEVGPLLSQLWVR